LLPSSSDMSSVASETAADNIMTRVSQGPHLPGHTTTHVRTLDPGSGLHW
jgi:hypothetical protein